MKINRNLHIVRRDWSLSTYTIIYYIIIPLYSIIMNDERQTVTIVGKNYLQEENDNTVFYFLKVNVRSKSRSTEVDDQFRIPGTYFL